MIWRSPATPWGIPLLGLLVTRTALGISNAGGRSGNGSPGGPSAPDNPGSTASAAMTTSPRADRFPSGSSSLALVSSLMVTANESPSVRLHRPSAPENVRMASSSLPEDRPVAMSAVPAPPMASKTVAAAPAATSLHRRCQPTEGVAGRSNRGWTRSHKSVGVGASLPSARSASRTRCSIFSCCSLMSQPPVLNSPISLAVARAPCSTATSQFPHGRRGRSPLP